MMSTVSFVTGGCIKSNFKVIWDGLTFKKTLLLIFGSLKMPGGNTVGRFDAACITEMESLF